MTELKAAVRVWLKSREALHTARNIAARDTMSWPAPQIDVFKDAEKNAFAEVVRLANEDD